MCVKEFLGFNCGHCAIPYLRLCPISSSQPGFPACKVPAERPIFTNEYCPPCSRVIWNVEVLHAEEVHRVKHENGECECEVIFSEEERVRRYGPSTLTPVRGNGRSRPNRGKGKKGEAKRLEREAACQENVQLVPHISAGVGVGENDTTGQKNYPNGPSNMSVGYGDVRYAFAPYNPPRQYETYLQYGPDASANHGYAQGSDLARLADGYGFPAIGYVPAESHWARQSGMGDLGGTSGMRCPQPDEMAALDANNTVYNYVPRGQGLDDRKRAASETANSADFLVSATSTVVNPTPKYCGGKHPRSETEMQTKNKNEHETETEIETQLEEPTQPLVVSSSASTSYLR